MEVKIIIPEIIKNCQ